MDKHASRVLIIGDEPAVLELCQQVLQHAELVVQIVASSAQAAQKLQHELFDLILLDLKAPAPDGLTPITPIRSLDSTIPIVLITDTVALEYVARSTRIGVQGVLLKPFAATELLETVTGVLQRRHALRTRNRIAALRPLVYISQRLLAELDLPRLYDLIIETVRVELKADRASLMLWDENREMLQIAACSGLPEEVRVGQRVEPGGSLAGWVASQGQPLLINSQYCSVPELERVLINDQLASALSVPLMAGEQVLGVLNAAKSHAASSFTEADQELLVLLAGQAAIAIENARLYNLAQRRADRLALLYKLSTAVTGSLDLEQIIITTMSHVSAALHVDHGYLFLSSDEPQHLVQYMTLRRGVLSALRPVDLLANSGIVGQVLTDGQARVLPAPEWRPDDATQTIPQYAPPWEQVVTVSAFPDVGVSKQVHDLFPIPAPLSPPSYWLCVALASEQGICGAIELLGSPGQRFGEDDVQFMMALAAPVAMAIEKARLHASVAHSEARYRALLQHATEAVLLLDADGQCILDANPAAEQLSGYSHAGLLQVDPRSLLPGVDDLVAGMCKNTGSDETIHTSAQGAHIAVVPAYAGSTLMNSWPPSYTPRPAKTTNEMEMLLQAQDGRSIPVSIGVSWVPYDDQQIVLVIARDISGRQRMAQQLLQTEKLAAVGRLSASIAHEINNPLQAIHNSLHLLNNRPLSDDKRQLYLSMAQDEVDRLISIVQRMLDFYRPSRDGVGMRLTNVHELLEAVLGLADKQMQTSRVCVLRDWYPTVPLVLANGNHLKQVYLNLILNAIESMPEGGMLTVRTYVLDESDSQAHMEFAVTSAVGSAGHRVIGPSVVVEFSDTGQGIPPDELTKVFEPFYTTRSTGTGLGLAISYSIVEQHHGELSVTSVVGQGTTFRIRLPIAT